MLQNSGDIYCLLKIIRSNASLSSKVKTFLFCITILVSYKCDIDLTIMF